MTDTKPAIKPGDRCTLQNLDWCGSTTEVTVLKVYSNGHARVLDGDWEREVAIENLSLKPKGTK